MIYLPQPGQRFGMHRVLSVVAGLVAVSAFAKIPAPVLDDAGKAKAAEAAAKTAWTGKLESFQLCKSMDKVAALTSKAGKTGAIIATPPCADPGAFVFPPPAAPLAPVAATGTTPVKPAPSGPAATGAVPAKKS